jgi:putative endonuclease
MYYVYFLRLKNYQIYIGFSDNLGRRISEHRRGKVKSTKHLHPFQLIGYEAYLLKSDAKRRERFLKTTEGKRLFKQQYRDILQVGSPYHPTLLSNRVVLSNDGTIGRPVE